MGGARTRVFFKLDRSLMYCFSRRVLLIAYPTGLQIWDCADLSALREVFDLDLGAAEWGAHAWRRRDGRADGPCRPCGRASMEQRRGGRIEGGETLTWHAVSGFSRESICIIDMT